MDRSMGPGSRVLFPRKLYRGRVEMAARVDVRVLVKVAVGAGVGVSVAVALASADESAEPSVASQPSRTTAATH